MESIEIQAKKRDKTGKGVVRKLRRAGTLPAVLYGGGQDPMPIELEMKAVERVLKTHSGEHSILNLSMEGAQSQLAMIKDVQAETVTSKLLHCDLLRIRMDEKLEVSVALEFINTETVKRLGGIIQQILNEITIECLPDHIPDKIQVDLSEIEVGESLHVGVLKVSEDITILNEKDEVIVTVLAPKELVEEKAAEEGAAEEGAKADDKKADKSDKGDKADKGDKGAKSDKPEKKSK
jgi:large subunit ribosomal protein L25